VELLEEEGQIERKNVEKTEQNRRGKKKTGKKDGLNK